MSFFSAGGQQERDHTSPEFIDSILQRAAQEGYTGDVQLPGQTLKFEGGNIVARKNTGQTWKRFAVEAALLVGGGFVAGGGLANPAAGGAGEAAADTSYIGADVANTAADALGTGSILNKVGNVTSKVAPILGNMAKAGAEANANRDRILPSMETAKLARDKFALDAPATRMNQSTRASILKSASPTKVNWGGPGSGLKGQVPQFTGGFSGALSNIDPRTKALADEVMNKDLTDQLAGKDGQTPYLDQFGRTSAMDKVVGGAATGASIWDAVKGIWR